MSRAFVNEDATFEPEPRYNLPERESPYYDEAAARALLDGANVGNTRSAEKATGYVWGEAALIPHIDALLSEAADIGDDRTVTLCRRFIRKAGTDG
ncbi:MAG: hypothetical protein ACC682_09550 [Gemmatimonadota bacterium]